MRRRSPGPMRRLSGGVAVLAAGTVAGSAGVVAEDGAGAAIGGSGSDIAPAEAEEPGCCACATRQQSSIAVQRDRQRGNSGVRIGNSTRGALKDETEDGVIGNPAAEGLPRRQDLIAFSLAGPGGEQDRIGKLRKHERISENGCGTVDDDEVELIAP